MMIIAIDGPAASGKGTLGRALAEFLNLAYLDTGGLYRALAWRVMKEDIDQKDPRLCAGLAQDLSLDDISNPAIRSDAVATVASQISAYPEVRQALLEFQRSFARNPGVSYKGAVLDGRDIGTVICPDADIKFFLQASAETRARRRLEDLQARGQTVTYDEVLQDLLARDERDTQRATAPLKPAPDAIILETSDLDAGEVFEDALGHLRGKIVF